MWPLFGSHLAPIWALVRPTLGPGPKGPPLFPRVPPGPKGPHVVTKRPTGPEGSAVVPYWPMDLLVPIGLYRSFAK